MALAIRRLFSFVVLLLVVVGCRDNPRDKQVDKKVAEPAISKTVPIKGI
jgi:hypothetical protein